MYRVVAYRNGAEVAWVGDTGPGLSSYSAVHFARELRQELPEAIVAILPRKQN
jgi:hypothetical protein